MYNFNIDSSSFLYLTFLPLQTNSTLGLLSYFIQIISTLTICIDFNIMSLNNLINKIFKGNSKLFTYLVQLKSKVRSEIKNSGKDYVGIAYNDENYEGSVDVTSDSGSGFSTEDASGSGDITDQDFSSGIEETKQAALLELGETTPKIPLDFPEFKIIMRAIG